MSNLIKVAAAAVNQTALDWQNNYRNIINAMAGATKEGVDILCLPELCITGYGCEDMFFSAHVQQTAWDMLIKIMTEIPKNMLVSVGLPIVHNGCLYNASAIIFGGGPESSTGLLALIPKQNMANDGVYYESRWFKRWPAGKTDYHKGFLWEIPIGDLIINLAGTRIGCEICQDAWVGDRSARSLAARGADIILNPSASHFALGKSRTREQFVIEGSRAFHCAYVYSNLLGNDSGRLIFDGHCMIASHGELLAEGKRLSLNQITLTTATIDVDQNRMLRLQDHSYSPAYNLEKEIYKKIWVLNNKEDSKPDNEINWIRSEFESAIVLGLYDYLRKSHSNGFVISLSGGSDSAAVAYLVYLMWNQCKSAGIELPPMSELLTCVYQKTDNSSEETESAAENLATEIGAAYLSMDIEPIVQLYHAFGTAVKESLSWDKDDIALQNVQARARVPGVWLIANLKNALLLNTSNRSEAAVGYTTADGDMCGGLAPIAGISKEYLLEWLRGAADYKCAALDDILGLKPTAELRPSDQGQEDEKDLMPYSILNYIEQLAIRDKCSPQEVYDKCVMTFVSDSTDRIKNWVNKFFKLWSRNQWKREKMPLAFHLDDRNLDPKTWCRFPVLSGSFEEIK